MEKGVVVEGSNGKFWRRTRRGLALTASKEQLHKKSWTGFWRYSAQWGHVLGVSSDSESESVGDLQPHSSSRPNSSRSDQRTHAKPSRNHSVGLLYITWTPLGHRSHLVLIMSTSSPMPTTDRPWIGAVDDEFRMYSCVYTYIYIYSPIHLSTSLLSPCSLFTSSSRQQ